MSPSGNGRARSPECPARPQTCLSSSLAEAMSRPAGQTPLPDAPGERSQRKRTTAPASMAPHKSGRPPPADRSCAAETQTASDRTATPNNRRQRTRRSATNTPLPVFLVTACLRQYEQYFFSSIRSGSFFLFFVVQYTDLPGVSQPMQATAITSRMVRPSLLASTYPAARSHLSWSSCTSFTPNDTHWPCRTE